MQDAKTRTLDLFTDKSNDQIEMEEDVKKTRTPYDIEAEFKQACGDELEKMYWGGLSVRVAKYKNGKRGLQITRGDTKNPSFASTVVITPFEYVELARCVFRDSQMVQDLVSAKTDEARQEIVSKILKFCQG